MIFSRKGFDLGSGGTASPIVDGRPISLPIPTSRRSATTYQDLGLGEIVERVTRGRIGRGHACHEDPMFVEDRCVFGQCGAAQSHLANQRVAVGDVFLFFGLFAYDQSGERHHRIFGYLAVERIIPLPEGAKLEPHVGKLPRPHPHTLGEWNANNTIYEGSAATARMARPELRLTAAGERLTHWRAPAWLRDTGLSFHGNEERWFAPERLAIVARGQEFVADIGDRPEPRRWLDGIMRAVAA